MNKIFSLLLAVTLSGCATVTNWIPSFWDDNQSARIIDVAVKIQEINCTQPQLFQIKPIERDLIWFETYSKAKGTLQADVLRVIAPMQETVTAWVKREQGSQGYCKLKKELLEQQVKRASASILGRY